MAILGWCVFLMNEVPLYGTQGHSVEQFPVSFYVGSSKQLKDFNDHRPWAALWGPAKQDRISCLNLEPSDYNAQIPR